MGAPYGTRHTGQLFCRVVVDSLTTVLKVCLRLLSYLRWSELSYLRWSEPLPMSVRPPGLLCPGFSLITYLITYNCSWSIYAYNP